MPHRYYQGTLEWLGKGLQWVLGQPDLYSVGIKVATEGFQGGFPCTVVRLSRAQVVAQVTQLPGVAPSFASAAELSSCQPVDMDMGSGGVALGAATSASVWGSTSGLVAQHQLCYPHKIQKLSLDSHLFHVLLQT